MYLKNKNMKEWKQKWNYQPCYKGEVSAKTKKEFANAQIKELYDTSSFSWNDFEREAVTKVIELANYMLKVNGFKAIKICDKQIIILTDKEFVKKIREGQTEVGKYSSGYIYVCRNEDRAAFVSNLAHEISHLLSFYSLRIEEKERMRIVNLRQTGLSFKTEDGKCLFDGLNEAFTDIWAKVILIQVFQRYPNLLSKEEIKEALISNYGYLYHALLLEEILFKLTKNRVLVWPLFKSYIDGSLDFILAVENVLPAAAKALKVMSREKESALEVAFLIGGDELRKKISME